MMKEWLRIALRRDVVLRGLKVGAIVGTVLTAINQGDVILAGQIAAAGAWKIPLTYLVPYCVSTYAGVDAILGLNKQGQNKQEQDRQGQQNRDQQNASSDS
jgi:hypothetical protein